MRAKSLAACWLLACVILTSCDAPTLEEEPTPQPQPGPSVVAGLWTVSGEPAEILRLAPQQLQAGGELAPATVVTTANAGLLTLNSIAFAQDGTLWVASADDAVLLAFTAGALAASGPREATSVIRPNGGSLQLPSSLAFDSMGRLWVANRGAGTLVRYDAEQLASGEAPAPSVVIAGVGSPAGLAFDAAGALWVSDIAANTIVRYGATQLQASGSPEPLTVLRAGAECLVNPSGLAFDAAGALWVANLGCGNVVAFGTSQLATSGSPGPRVTLSWSEPVVGIPVGVAFDADGDLWVLGGTGTVAEFAEAGLTTGGARAPNTLLTVAGHNLFWSLAFWPRPTGLPLN